MTKKELLEKIVSVIRSHTTFKVADNIVAHAYRTKTIDWLQTAWHVIDSDPDTHRACCFVYNML